MNEQLMKQDLGKAYRSIRIIKEIQRGTRRSMDLAKKVKCTQQLAAYYIARYVQGKGIRIV